ncbi:alpha/beta hydrolase [Chitinophaga terrae (ex Kim and Jung 2007)]|nr:alpha/beta hydrolase [Chitinophaga terrae (ex Kim and Jung 2007)]
MWGIPIISIAQISANGCYTEQEVELSLTLEDQLYGTLTIPETNSRGIAVVIVPGSGPTDRDGNQYGLIYTNAYKFIAHELAKVGISCLRYDKAGVGASIGPNYNERKLSFDSYANSLQHWIKQLKEEKGIRKIVLIGHSEGTILAMIAAGKIHVDAYIGIAGPGSPADSVLLQQIKESMPARYSSATSIIDSIKMGKIATNIPSELKLTFRPSIQPYLRSFFEYDPCQLIKGLNCPILLIQGDSDLQIKTEEAVRLSKANPAAKLVLIEGMNHVLKNCAADPQLNLKSYHLPLLTLDPTLMPTITTFIDNTLK